MEIEQVIELIKERLRQENMTGINALVEYSLFSIACDVWVLHRALPDMPVTSIINRRITGRVDEHERRFWQDRGLATE